MQSKVLFWGTLIIYLFEGCDPEYNITIINKTSDTAVVYANVTMHFGNPGNPNPTNLVHDSLDYNKVRFTIAPGEEFMCGRAMGEIDDELPFEQIKILYNTDSLVAKSSDEVKDIFDKNILGSISTPYQITVK